MTAQTFDALRLANEVRYDRAALRATIRDTAGHGIGQHDRGRLALADAVERNPMCLHNARLWDVLGWPPKTHAAVKRRVMRHIGVRYDYRTVGELTDRQRTLLVSVLRSPALLDTDREIAA